MVVLVKCFIERHPGTVNDVEINYLIDNVIFNLGIFKN